MNYVASLDGIRAIAIAAVLIFHVAPKMLSGGSTGVDVFFVLSGFLITSIILQGVRDGSFSMREFYLRRVQRLLPNALAVILAVLLLWTFCLPPGAAVQPGVHGLWTLANLSNIYIWKNLGGYWGAAAETAPLTHFWSLAIEEQFYIILPASLLLLLRFQSRQIQIWLGLTAVLSFGLCLYGAYTKPSAAFYLLPTRFWELMLGGILAAYLDGTRRQTVPGGFSLGLKSREAIGWAGVAIIAAGFFFIGKGNRSPGLVSLAPTVGTVFVLLSVMNGESTLSRWLTTAAMVEIGILSYSIYLWHWPLIVFCETQADLRGQSHLLGAIAGGIGGIVMGWGAYKCIEQPLRKRGPGRSRRLAAVAAGFLVTALGCAFTAHRHVEMDPDHRFDRPSWSSDLYNSGVTDQLKFTDRSFDDAYLPPVPPHPEDAWRTGGIIHLYGGGQPRVVVLGSSHALMYSRLIDDLCRERGISVAFLGMSLGAPAFFEAKAGPNFTSTEEAHEFDEARKAWLAKWHPAACFVIDRWDIRLDTMQDFDQRLRAFLKVASPLAGHVIFAAQVPVLNVPGQYNLRALISWRMGRQQVLPRLFPDANEKLRQEAVAVADAARVDFPNLRVIRPDSLFYLEDGSVRYAEGRSFFYQDDNHLTDAGSDQARGVFLKAITDSLPAVGSPGKPLGAAGGFRERRAETGETTPKFSGRQPTMVMAAEADRSQFDLAFPPGGFSAGCLVD